MESYCGINQGIQCIPVINLVQTIAVAMVRDKTKGGKKETSNTKTTGPTRDIKQFGLLKYMYIIYEVSSQDWFFILFH